MKTTKAKLLQGLKFEIAQQKEKARIRTQFNKSENQMYKELNREKDDGTDLAKLEVKLSTLHKEILTRDKMLMYSKFESVLEQLQKKLDLTIEQIIKSELNGDNEI